MLPNNQTWSNVKGILPYGNVPSESPVIPQKLVSFKLLGPNALNQSANALNTRWWMVTQENGKVNIRGAL